MINAKTDFGALGDDQDYTSQLQAAAAAADSTGDELLIPAGSYKTTAPIQFHNVACTVRGDGARTWLKPAPGVSGILFGDSTKTNGVVAGGKVSNLVIYAGSTPPAPRSGSIGLGLIRATQVSVERVTVYGGFDMAFDLNNNCYGSEFRNCRALFGNNNVGMNIRQGTQSGADLHFSNNWLSGNLAGVWIDGFGGGYHFFSGQLSAGHRLTAPDETLGVVTLNSDYLTQAVHSGADNINFVGVSWEGWHNAWAIRSRAKWSGTFDNANFNATGGDQGCRGLWKADAVADSKVKFSNCGLGGTYNNLAGKLMDIGGQFNGQFQLVEEAWKETNSTLTVNGGAGIDIARKGSVAQVDGWTNGTTSITPGGVYYGGVKLT